jgi:hypothetical protein
MSTTLDERRRTIATTDGLGTADAATRIYGYAPFSTLSRTRMDGVAASESTYVYADGELVSAHDAERGAKQFRYNAFGELGDGTAVDRSSPTLVVDNIPAAVVRSGASHTCALTPAGVAYCWGDNVTGQLGDGTTVTRSRPVLVEP